MQSRIALIDLHHVRVDIIGVAADEGRLTRQCKLHAAFSQCQLSLLASLFQGFLRLPPFLNEGGQQQDWDRDRGQEYL